MHDEIESKVRLSLVYSELWKPRGTATYHVLIAPRTDDIESEGLHWSDPTRPRHYPYQTLVELRVGAAQCTTRRSVSLLPVQRARTFAVPDQKKPCTSVIMTVVVFIVGRELASHRPRSWESSNIDGACNQSRCRYWSSWSWAQEGTTLK